MKRFIISLLLFLLIPLTAFGAEADEYKNSLSEYDLSFFEDELDGDTYRVLEELGISEFSYESIYQISVQEIINSIINIIGNKLKSPMEGLLSVIVFVIISAFFTGIQPEETGVSDVYETVSSLLVSVILIVKISPCITSATASIGVSADFIYAFIPVFCAITAASGGLTVSFSTNSVLLLLSQGLSFASSKIFVPVINCFLALGICTSLRPQLGLSKLTDSLRRLIIAALSALAGAYVSILSIKTAASAKADALGLRSVRFVISSVVPVIGGALSEGLVSIQAYSSIIKSSVGIVGIIAVVFVFLPSVTEVVLWRLTLGICSLISEVFCDRSVTSALRAFSSALLVMNVILVISALTTVVSIGILIAAGS